MSRSKIEWTESTWNPVTGCSPASEGCAHCYAARMAKRLQAMGVANYRDGFQPREHPGSLDAPLHWQTPQRIFVASMSDLFHESFSESFVRSVFDVMNRAAHHQFLVLTKRAERLVEIAGSLSWTGNIWAGVTVESAQRMVRIDALRDVPAAVRFVSFEPLLTEIPQPNLSGIDWIIVGGESGPGARPMSPDWVRRLRDTASTQRVAFFFKQWGGVRKNTAGRELDGRTWDQMPQELTTIPATRSA